MLKKLIVAGSIGAFGVGAVIAALGGVVASATTDDTAGLSAPKVELSRHIGDAFEGRFFLKRAPREAKLKAAQLDIALETESDPNFYFGEMALETYNSKGTPETRYLDLWWFYFHKRHDRMTVRLIPPGSVSSVNQDGETVGELSFAVPLGKDGLANNGLELDKAEASIQLKGQASCPLTFVRTTDDNVNVQKIPPAELYNGRC